MSVRPSLPSTPPSTIPTMADQPPLHSSTVLALRAWSSQAVVASFIAGGVAGAVSRTVVSPLERLKILWQVQTTAQTEYRMSISKALGKIWREEGFKGMMAGNGTNCIRIVPYSAVQFGSYNFYKRVSSYLDVVAQSCSRYAAREIALRSLELRLTDFRDTLVLRSLS